MKKIIPFLLLLASCSKSTTSTPTPTVLDASLEYTGAYSALAGGTTKGTGFNFTASVPDGVIVDSIALMDDTDFHHLDAVNSPGSKAYSIFDFANPYETNTHSYHFVIFQHVRPSVIYKSFKVH